MEESGSARVLACSPNLPGAMDRQSWTLRDYHITNTLYSGYAAQVYTATCKYSGMEVVLKVYNDVNKAPDVAQHEMYREVAIQSSLQHHNIVHLFAAFQEGQTLVLVQEYAPGGDLLGLMAAHGGRVDEATVVKTVLRPLLEALLYLHRWGIVHRDVKPENVLFAADGTVKLADFGLAINMVEERPISRVGTLDYMAPEVLRCPIKQHMGMAPGPTTPARYGFATDCWAVGVVTFELLTGLPPYASDCRYQAEARIIAAAPPPFPHGMSHPARDFIRRLLAPIPGDRPTVRQLLTHPWVVDPDACVSAHLHHQHAHAMSSASAYHSHHHLPQHPQQHASSTLAGAATASSLSATAYSHAHVHALPPHPYAPAAAAYSPYGSAHVYAHAAVTAASAKPSASEQQQQQQQQQPSTLGGVAGDATCSVAAGQRVAGEQPCASGKQPSATAAAPTQHAAGPAAEPMLLSSYSTLPYTQASAAAAAAAAAAHHHHAHAMAHGYPHPPHLSAYHPGYHYHGSHGALNTLAAQPAPLASPAPDSSSHGAFTIPTFSAGKQQLLHQTQPQQQTQNAPHQPAASAAGQAAASTAEADPVRQLNEQLRALQQQQLLDLSKLPLDQIQSVIAKLQEAMRMAVAQQQQQQQVVHRGTDGGATAASAVASPAPATQSAVSAAAARAATAGAADVQMEEAADVGASQAGACGSVAAAHVSATAAATPAASGSCVHSSCHSPHSPLSVARGHNAAAASTGGAAPSALAPHEPQAAATPFAFAASLASHILHHASTAMTAGCDTASHASTATPTAFGTTGPSSSLTASRRTTVEAAGPAVACCRGALTAEAVTAALLDMAHQQLQQQCHQQAMAPTPMPPQCGSRAATPRTGLFEALPHHSTIHSHSHAHTPLVIPTPPAAAPSTSGGGAVPMDRASGGGGVHDGDGLVYVSIGSSRKLPVGSIGGAPPQPVVVLGGGGNGGGGSSGAGAGTGAEDLMQQAARLVAETWFKPQLAAAMS